MLLVTAAGGASASRIPYTLGAPFHHVQKGATLSSDVSGCARLHPAPLRWHSSLGIANWYALTTAHSCRSLLGTLGVGSTAAYASDLTVGVPFATFPGAATPTSVAITWSFDVVANASVRSGGLCPTVVVSPTNGSGSEFCYLGGIASLSAVAYVKDLTNGTVFYPANYWSGIDAVDFLYNETDCVAYSCATLNYSYAAVAGSGLPVTASWWINASLDHSHKYLVVTDLYGNVTAETIGFPSSRASAVLDFESIGRYASLVAVTVS